MNVKEIIESYVKSVKDYEGIEGQSSFLSLWRSWYNGFDKDFHYYYIRDNEGMPQQKTKKSFQGAKMVSQDWANLIANEKCDIVIDAKDQETLENILYGNNFWLQLNSYYEQAMALSISGAVLTITGIEVSEDGVLVGKSKEMPKITFVKPEQVYPITIENGTITECAFAVDNTRTATIIIYLKDDVGNYEVHSLLCKKGAVNGAIQMPNEDAISVFKTGTNKKWFTTFSPNLANNLSCDSSLPISVYANAIDNLKALDNKYDGFDDEYWLGKRRIFVSADLQKVVKVSNSDGTEDTKYIPTFDNNDLAIYTLPPESFGTNNGALNKVQSVAEPLRSQDYIAGINQELSYLSKKCGLGLNRYQFDAGGRPIQTATGVISANSELYQNLRKHEILLEQSLKEFTLALIEACNLYTNISFKQDYEYNTISIKFDDSIIEDKDAEQTRDRTNVQAGLMSEVEYRVKWFGETEEDAKKFVYDNLRYKIINNNLSALSGGAMSVEEFVEICYGDKNEQEKQALIEYITEQKKSSSVNPFQAMEEE